ncbi:hypothetical protein PIB30_083584 [Stylosanthes scabra]|uniref:Uncharacterized protein n=1 Tax=Stylosanthes scabra TaxID=79078 RepID=A0ABU6XTE2_9FABA|nr:hypothetical protein [Stylosanthes scabra]
MSSWVGWFPGPDDYFEINLKYGPLSVKCHGPFSKAAQTPHTEYVSYQIPKGIVTPRASTTQLKSEPVELKSPPASEIFQQQRSENHKFMGFPIRNKRPKLNSDIYLIPRVIIQEIYKKNK